MRFQLQLSALLLALTSACTHLTEAPIARNLETRPITAPGQFEVTVPIRNDGPDMRHLCSAAAQSRNANWTGLWWTPQRSGEIACALAPRRHNAVEAPLMESSGCQSDLCESRPIRLVTNGTRPTAIHERADDASRIIGQVSPGEPVTLFDRMHISTFSHRGVVRRATNSLAVGAVVFPAPFTGEEPFPWRPRPPGPDEMGYTVRTVPYAVIEFIPIDADEPYVEWTPLAPLRGNTSWVLLEDSDGVKGWAAEFALGIDFQDPDENE